MESIYGESQSLKDRRRDALGDLRVVPDEILCFILTTLTPHDVARLSCVSSVMYILCNEEPLWMSLCLGIVNRQLEYKGSWKKTTLHQLDLLHKYNEDSRRTLQFDGFSSMFLYRRLYRCHTSLNGFSFDDGNVERKEKISFEEFHMEYDSQKPVMMSGLTDNWPARKSWTREGLLLKYPEKKFRISQRSSKKISMTFKDYVSYMQVQHDEDPLYIFDDKFGEVAPDMLKDYTVPHIFKEDYFDVLDTDQRPPYRWFIVGPERSGASWHVDPGLTSAWNTLLYGRKRWALYPPGRVPLGVTMHVNEDNGDVNIETPSSLQWWLEFYPLLSDNDKPIECTQLPGETIYVPSGWWHCVLNLETTIAVTQNFVNSKNFEFVCLDMAPGYRHKGVCRAGLLALDESSFEDIEKNSVCIENESSYIDLNRREKRVRIEDRCSDDIKNGMSISNGGNLEFSYDISFLAKFLDHERDHYNSRWSSGNCIGQREMRDWLWKLWVGRPELRDLIWKGACLSLNAGKWYECARAICNFHEFPEPSLDEKLPVGTGSNPVYLADNYVIKIFVEGGLEASLYCLGTELEFYNSVHKFDSSLKKYIPSVLASGILHSENGSYRVLPWDGRGIPELIAKSSVTSIKHEEDDYPFGLWGKKKFEYQNAGRPLHELGNCAKTSSVWPYIVTRKCSGKIFAEVRNTLSSEDELNLASFLGEQLHNLHMLPVPHLSCNDSVPMVSEDCVQPSNCSGFSANVTDKIGHPADLELFISILNKKRKDVANRLTEWGDPIPSKLIEKADEYIPHDVNVLFDNFEKETECRSCTWIHSDVMDDNIYMKPCYSDSILEEKISEPCVEESAYIRKSNNSNNNKLSWVPNYILDFGNLSAGEPILDLIPLYLDVFRGDPRLLKQFLNSYKLPFVRRKSSVEVVDGNKYDQLSYRAMCYCILHDENILGAIFSIWKELRSATSWEEVEQKVWGDLNSYI